MAHPDRHIADADLLLAVDRELPAGRRAAVELHMADCALCRMRYEQLEQTTADLVLLCENDVVVKAEASCRSRTRLSSKLTEAAADWDCSSNMRFLSLLAVAPRWALLVPALLLAATLVHTLHWSVAFNQPTAPVERGALPIASVTPGAVLEIGVGDLCAGRGGGRHLPLPATVRQQVLRDYGMERIPSAEYELDYLITPELGGAADRRNIWPQRYTAGRWNALVKDRLERELPQLVCNGRIDLRTAQREIAVDWVAAYKKYLNTEYPIQARESFPADDPEFIEPADHAATTPGVPVLAIHAFSRSSGRNP